MSEVILPGERMTGVPRSSLDVGRVAMWAGLLPIMLLFRPYRGLMQDARIYVGRGVADLDLTGVGRDMMFAHDEQTGFSAMRAIVDALLTVMSPSHASMLLTLSGLLIWLVSAAALARSVARGRVAWATVVCMLVLPAQYGAYSVFSYADAIATPRVFAQAGVLGGLAALLGGRRRFGLLLMAFAAVLHPLITLPGLALAAVLLVRDDRRWLLAVAAACATLAGAVALGLPLANRLLIPIDPLWMSILRERSRYLFPSLWPRDSFGPIAAQLVAVVVAGSLSSDRTRALFWGIASLSVGGLAVSFLLGDSIPSLLVTQLQFWRVLWLLAVLGNAALVVAAVRLWSGGPPGRTTLALLALTWLTSAEAPLASVLAAVTFGAQALACRGEFPAISARTLRWAAATVAGVALAGALQSAAALDAFVRSALVQGGEVTWSAIVNSEVLIIPVVAILIGTTFATRRGLTGRARVAVGVMLVAISLPGMLLWDSRTSERRLTESAADAATVQAMIGPGPGEVLWVDDDSEAWFVAGRPSFMSTVQAGPILFSRDLALAWHSRTEMLRGLGLTRSADVTPWAELPRGNEEVVLSPAAVRGFCGDPSRPTAIVAPGRQLVAAPEGWVAHLWRPPFPIHRFSADDAGAHWRRIDIYTVIRCPRSDSVGNSAAPLTSPLGPIKSVRSG